MRDVFFKKDGKVYLIDSETFFECDLCQKTCGVNAMEVTPMQAMIAAIENDDGVTFLDGDVDLDGGVYEDETGDFALCSECYVSKTNCSK